MTESPIKNNLPVIEVYDNDSEFIKLLIEGKLVAYHNSHYEVTRGEHEILIRMLGYAEEITVFYVHVPYAYPLPIDLKEMIIKGLEEGCPQSAKKISFVNVGVESQKKEMLFRMELGGEF